MALYSRAKHEEDNKRYDAIQGIANRALIFHFLDPWGWRGITQKLDRLRAQSDKQLKATQFIMRMKNEKNPSGYQKPTKEEQAAYQLREKAREILRAVRRQP